MFAIVYLLYCPATMLAVMRMKLSGSMSATSKSTKTVSAVRLTAMFLKSWIAPKSRKSDKRLLARVLTLSTVVLSTVAINQHKKIESQNKAIVEGNL